MVNLENILKDIVDDILKVEKEATLQLERCAAKLEVIDAISSYLADNKEEEKPLKYTTRPYAVDAKAKRALSRR